ncbi:MAG: alpha/beta hydrolase [Rhodospirillales bacterium]|nr:alpha/beta hydrolase [Rhodospirillales bacterium]
MVQAERLTIEVGPARRVSALLLNPSQARACYVLAHGAGAGMSHPFLEAVAQDLQERGIASLRYQFPYMEQGSKRPDPPPVAHATVRAAVAEAARLLPDVPLVAGGKSFGGRMSSQAEAAEPMPPLLGIAFLGFPLHPAGRPSLDRAAHLQQVARPMLFLQGTRDALADAMLMEQVARQLGHRATLTFFPDADHSFHVPARSGRSDAEVRRNLLDAFEAWLRDVIGR